MSPPRKIRRKRERIEGRLEEAEAENEQLWEEPCPDPWVNWGLGDNNVYDESLYWDDAAEAAEGDRRVVFQSGFHRELELPTPLLEWAAAKAATEPNVSADAEDWALVDSLLIKNRRSPQWQSAQVEIGALIHHPFFRRYSGPPPSPSELTLIDLLLVTQRLWLRPLPAWKVPNASLREALVNLVHHLLVAYRLPGWLQPDRVASYADCFGGPCLSPDARSEVWLPFLAAARGLAAGDGAAALGPRA